MMNADAIDDDALGLPLANARPLADFLAGRIRLTAGQRQLIVEQAIGVLENVYAHLPIKRTLYGIDPVGRLQALRDRLDVEQDPDDLPFHRAMAAILSTCHDMHTGYYLPRPFDRGVAFLPFQIEDVAENPGRRYIVPRILPDCPDLNDAPEFRRGVEIVAWDGDPVDDAVLREGEASPGINAGARHARGVYRLTTRFLAKCPPPEQDSVRVTYRTAAGKDADVVVRWRVTTLPPDVAALPEGVAIVQASSAGSAVSMPSLDFETEAFRAMKRILAARGIAPPADVSRQYTPLDTCLPVVFEAAERTGYAGAYGYIRIRSFGVDDPMQAAREFVRLVGLLPPAGLVIDVRDNPGGSIEAAEMILQALAGRALERAPLVFRATPFVLRLCEQRPDMYERWLPTLIQAAQTGAMFSVGAPLWPDAAYSDVPQCDPRPAVLVVSALSYSATDFFAAGFQDHRIGPVLGVHPTTGGGGGNMWTLRSLVQQIAPDRDRFAGLWTPVPLPAGADIHTALRRSYRTGRNAGLAVEDFGVAADAVHAMTRRDALQGNPDLFDAAVRLLQPPGATPSST